MSFDSLVASEPDSLTDKEHMEKLSDGKHFVRGNVNTTTFTRPRPINLSRHQTRGHRQSLLSPQSVDNIETDITNTPDFAMTQSMYEPYGKKEQIEKLNHQSKLMSLIASEKAAYAAQKRKQKEIKQKISEQKKRNEERQKIVEDRRIKMLAEEEEKRRRILKKTIQCNSIMTQSTFMKCKPSSTNNFLSTRPLSSTGKIFGFGSSAPRYTCDPIKQDRPSNSKSSVLDMSREFLPLSRMCTSQIVTRSVHPETKGHSQKNFSNNISKSTANISDINKLRNKNTRGSITNVNNPATKHNANIRISRTTPKSIKLLNSTNKIEVSTLKLSESHNRSRSSKRDTSVPTKPRSTTMERKDPLLHKSPVQNTPVIQVKNPKKISKSDDNRLNSNGVPAAVSAGNKTIVSQKRPFSIRVSDGECEQNTGRKSEVRFVSAALNCDKPDKENSNVLIENRKSNPKEITDEEYKQQMALKRKLVKEKRKRDELERQIEKVKQLSENLADPLASVDVSMTTDSEISINILPIDASDSQSENIVQIAENNEVVNVIDDSVVSTNIQESYKEITETKPEDITVSILSDVDDSSGTDRHYNTGISTTIPTIEVPKEKMEMAASTDQLDRIERKKRLDSIMSRIKKTPSGSTENVNHHITTSALQNMMDKGHLSGMSKAAAVLMRNANRSSELWSSNSEIPSSTENRKSSISMETISNAEKNTVDIEVVNRGDCDGKEDSPKDTKSNIMQSLTTQADGSYFTSWKEKYSVSDSLDSEYDKSEGTTSYK